MIFSCIASERPTANHPMTVDIPSEALTPEYRNLLKADSSWKNGSSCEFALDPTGLKLMKGSVPGYELTQISKTLVVSRLPGPQLQREEDPMPAWIAETLTYIRDKAPALDREKLADIKSRPDLFRNSPLPDDIPLSEGMIRALLVLWKYDDSPTTLENVWFSSHDRRMRALAAALVQAKEPPSGGNQEEPFNIEKECRRFEAWEAAQRDEERNHHIAAAIHKALKAWEARVADPEKQSKP
jgi:hypothetical protein